MQNLMTTNEKIRIGIVVSEFNREITYSMLREAKNYACKFSIKITYIVFVPGVFDMPIMAKELLKKADVDAIVALGAVIKGETGHDKIIANSTARLLGKLSIKYSKPISLGVTGPEMTYDQAKARILSVSQHSIKTAVSMTNRLRKIRNNKLKHKEIKVID